MKYDNVIDAILDDNCMDSIFLEDEKGNKYEYEQEAVIPYDGKLYAILVDVEMIKQERYDEAGEVFFINEKKGTLELVDDINIISEVFEVYDKLMEEKENEA